MQPSGQHQLSVNRIHKKNFFTVIYFCKFQNKVVAPCKYTIMSYVNPENNTAMNLKKTLCSFAMGAVLLAAGSAESLQAASASGTTTLTMTLPNVIILHYINSVSLTSPAPDISDYVDEGSGTWTTVNGVLFQSTSELNTGNLGNTNPEPSNAQTATIKNVWAVRGLSPTGYADIAITIPDDEMEHNSGIGGAIKISDPKVIYNNIEVGTGGVPLNGMSKNDATFGDVRLTFNFDDAIKSGAYSNASYTITATSL